MNYLKEVESRGLNGFQMAEVREGLKTLTTLIFCALSAKHFR